MGPAFATGAPVWKYPVAQYASSQAVANGVLYVVPNLGVLALDAKTGVRLWETSTGGAANAPLVANGVLYLSAQDYNLYAFNAGTGALLWKYGFSKGSPSPPAVVNGLVYIASHSLYAFALPSEQMSEKFSPPEPPDPARLTPDWSLQPGQVVTSKSVESQ
jgi:outer membrane protein assembly factor BamB